MSSPWVNTSSWLRFRETRVAVSIVNVVETETYLAGLGGLYLLGGDIERVKEVGDGSVSHFLSLGGFVSCLLERRLPSTLNSYRL